MDARELEERIDALMRLAALIYGKGATEQQLADHRKRISEKLYAANGLTYQGGNDL